MSKEGIKNYKFVFQATIGKLNIAIKFPCEIKLTWKRSNEIAEIEPIPLENSCINFNRKISLNVNMYYDENLQKFLQKKSVFSLILVTAKGQKSAGLVTLDLAVQLNNKIQQYKNVYPLEKCPVPNSNIEISIFSYVVGQQDIDSISQMTGAQQFVSNTTIESYPTASTQSSFFTQGDSTIYESDKKSVNPSAIEYIPATVLPSNNSLSKQTSKINEISNKLGTFSQTFADQIKKQITKLKDKNKSITLDLEQQKRKNASLQEQISKLRLQNDNLRSQAELKEQQYNRNIERLNQQLSRTKQQLATSENMKKSLESNSLSNDSQKLQYINSLKAEKQQIQSRLQQEKKKLEISLQQERDQNYALKTKNNSLTNQIKSLNQNLSNNNNLRKSLEQERQLNERQVEEARIRLEKVYAEMVNNLRDLI